MMSPHDDERPVNCAIISKQILGSATFTNETVQQRGNVMAAACHSSHAFWGPAAVVARYPM